MKILFLCVANSARSQMAEGLAQEIFGKKADIASAGSAPSVVNPLAIEVMKEIGIDISSHQSKSIDTFNLADFDLIITLCADEVCPMVPNKTKKLHWPIPDPAGMNKSPEQALLSFRNIRNQLQAKIKKFSKEV